MFARRLCPWLAAAAVVAAGPAPAADPAPAVQVVLVADTDDPKIGPSCGADLVSLRKAFGADRWPEGTRVHVGEFSGRVVRHPVQKPDGEWVTAREAGNGRFAKRDVLGHLRAMPLDAGTRAVVVFFTGHGDYSERNGHRVLFPEAAAAADQVLPAEEVFRAVAGRGVDVPLVAVLTDACSVFVPVPPQPAPPPVRAVRVNRLEELFLKPSGLVQVNASVQGTTAAALPLGGVMTRAFCQYLEDGADRNPVTWKWLMTGLQARMDKIYTGRGLDRQVRGPNGQLQSTQRPQAFRLPANEKADPPRRFLLGLPVPKDSPADLVGADVQEVGEPAGEVLRRGDVITAVNGLRVRNWDELLCVLEFHAPEREVRVTFKRDGARQTVAIRRKDGPKAEPMVDPDTLP